MSTELHRWRKCATTEEWAQLAKLANTTPGYLDQIAYGNRRASPEMALAIENATKQFHHQDPVLKESLVFASPRNIAVLTTYIGESIPNENLNDTQQS